MNPSPHEPEPPVSSSLPHFAARGDRQELFPGVVRLLWRFAGAPSLLALLVRNKRGGVLGSWAEYRARSGIQKRQSDGRWQGR
jgi:hypothetical protein